MIHVRDITRNPFLIYSSPGSFLNGRGPFSFMSSFIHSFNVKHYPQDYTYH